MTIPDTCTAVLERDLGAGAVEQWPCRRQPGHEGEHLSDATRRIVRWPQAAQEEAEGA